MKDVNPYQPFLSGFVPRNNRVPGIDEEPYEKKGIKGIFSISVLALCGLLFLNGCTFFNLDEKPQPRLVMFVGVDVSGSFLKGKYFGDSMDFLANYLYAHLNGLGGLEVPNALFVGSLGGARPGQPKAFYPIETFQNKSVTEISAKLKEIFPQDKPDPYTDYNAFLDQISDMVKDRKMVLKPISVVMVSDGELDVPGKGGRHDYRSIDFYPMEKLSRNITVRLLYTNPTVGKMWEDQIPRRRVKVWTQDAEVVTTWKDPKIYRPDAPIDQQQKFFAWLKDNVDFSVRMKRVD
jgi:hypothetical protein